MDDAIEQLQMGVSTIATALLRRASTVANFVGKMGVASADIGNCTIYSQRARSGYHHSRTFSRELEKIYNNSRTFSFADYFRYTV